MRSLVCSAAWELNQNFFSTEAIISIWLCGLNCETHTIAGQQDLHFNKILVSPEMHVENYEMEKYY